MADVQLEFPPIVDAVRQVAAGGRRVWVVGGAVRDALLRHRIYDLDFAVDGDALALGRAVARELSAAYYPLDPERGVGRVIAVVDSQRLVLDFARLRGPDLAADLAARDFTINAMAADLAEPGRLIDPLGGETDLRAKIIRACSPAAMADDPVRTVRAVRLAAQLGFRLDRATRAAVRAEAGSLARIAAERRRDEFVRCLTGPQPAAAVRALAALGLLEHLTPEVIALQETARSTPSPVRGAVPAADAWEHTLAVLARLRDLLSVLSATYDVDTASDLFFGLAALRLGRHRAALSDHLDRLVGGERTARAVLMTAALLHAVGKPAARHHDGAGHERLGAHLVADRLTELRFSNEEVRRAAAIVAHHGRPLALARRRTVTRRDVYRYFRSAGEAGVDAALLALADFLGAHAAGPPPVDDWNRLLDVAVTLLRGYYEQHAEVVDPPPLITGDDLMREMQLQPGPRVGRLLEMVREAQAAGKVPDRAAALALARRLAGDD